MVRVRVVLLVTIAALLAPSVTPCLLAAPAGHAVMPCCRTAKDAVPVVRPCCGPADPEPSTPASPTASVFHGATPIVNVVAFAPIVTPRLLHASASTLAPVRSRVPSSVLLI